MRYFIKLCFVVLMICSSVCANAQSAGDRLFKQGQELQMKQNERSQNQAIAKFAAAKKAYDSADKKAMCDNQIKICKNNIVTIRKNTVTKKSVEPIEKEEKTEPEPEKQKDPVSLSLSESAIEFKASGKKDDNHQVTVNCNYDNWTYESLDWINITKNGNILTLTASANDTGEERSGIFVVECDGVKAELMIYQKAKFSLKTIVGGKKSKK